MTRTSRTRRARRDVQVEMRKTIEKRRVTQEALEGSLRLREVPIRFWRLTPEQMLDYVYNFIEEFFFEIVMEKIQPIQPITVNVNDFIRVRYCRVRISEYLILQELSITAPMPSCFLKLGVFVAAALFFGQASAFAHHHRRTKRSLKRAAGYYELTPIENMKAQELKAELDMRKVHFTRSRKGFVSFTHNHRHPWLFQVSYVGCYDKTDLQDLLRESRSLGRADPELLDQFNRQVHHGGGVKMHVLWVATR